jgi:predicted NAD-dependent protein-ADP-ribosyltransferase YbiA (DUF1768 family)
MGGGAVIDDVYYEEFDNFYTCDILINEGPLAGMWKSSEHIYQALKHSDPVMIELIRNAQSVGLAYHYGHSNIVQPSRKTKIELMSFANYEKYGSNRELAKKLYMTNGPIKIKYGNKFWKREMAEILDEIRENLKS